MSFINQKLKAVPHKNVRIEDDFWSPKLKIMRDVTLPDVFTKFENDHEGAFNNFDWVRDGVRGKHAGPPWYDGLIYETMRAASDFLGDHYDRQLDSILDRYIGKIAAAQKADPDGYIDTFITLMRPGKKWGENGGNLLWQHNVYNAGCLVEAAVHHYKATGKTSFLNVAVRLANYMTDYMGLPIKKTIVPAHSLPEEAFVKLYQLFKDNPEVKSKLTLQVDEEQYLRLAKFWIDNRGRHKFRKSYPRNMGEYAQDHRPLIEQDEAMGHAVRAALLYNGLIALAMETGDEAYFNTSVKLWESAVYRKMHITGGVGAVHNEEKFGYEYQLPNDAYLETCAAVAIAFWTGNMNLAFGESRYMDVFERVLYNGVLPGLSLEGNKYFYRNPLVSKEDDHRWEWHECPCCPPMYLKIMADLQSYIYAYDEDGIYINLFIGGNADICLHGKPIRLTQKTGYPWSGDVSINVTMEQNEFFKIGIRIPDWCKNYKIKVNGINYSSFNMTAGYAVITREWNNGDEITLNMEMPVVRMEAHPYVEADEGKVAIQRGPLVYCFEGIDNNGGLNIALPANPGFKYKYIPELLDGVVLVKGRTADGTEFEAVPYYAWDNREPGTMCVWVGQEKKEESNESLEGWDDKLYRPLKLTDK